MFAFLLILPLVLSAPPTEFSLSTATCTGQSSEMLSSVTRLATVFGTHTNNNFPNLTSCNLVCIRQVTVKRFQSADIRAISINALLKAEKRACECGDRHILLFAKGARNATTDAGQFRVSEVRDRGLTLLFTVSSTISCTLLYPIAGAPGPTRPSIAGMRSGVWDQARRTVNAVASVSQGCENYAESSSSSSPLCIYNPTSVELGPGLWRVDVFGVLSGRRGGAFSLCVYDSSNFLLVPWSCSSTCVAGSRDQECTMSSSVTLRADVTIIVQMAARAISDRAWRFGQAQAQRSGTLDPLFRVSATLIE